MRNYLDRVRKSLSTSWDKYWFSAAQLSTLTRLRLLVTSVAGIWFVSLGLQVDWYFFPGGWLNSSLAKQLSIATHGEWATSLRITPLWLSDQAVVFHVYSLLGCLLALVAFVGLGGRWTMALLFLWILLLSHRLIWITGCAEPALTAMVGYLIFQPGRPLWSKRLIAAPPAEHWTAGLTLRLVQTHGWLLVAFGLLHQLASVVWWRGDAVWWLAATGRSTILTSSFLEGRELLVNALTHGIVLTEVLALTLLLFKLARPIGYVLGLAVCLSYALIADQVLYGLILAASLHAFCDPRSDD